MAKPKREVIPDCIEAGYGKIPGGVGGSPCWKYKLAPGSAYMREEGGDWDVTCITAKFAEDTDYTWKLAWITGKTVAIFTDPEGVEYAQPVPISSPGWHRKEEGKACRGCGSTASIHMSDCSIKYPKKSTLEVPVISAEKLKKLPTVKEAAAQAEAASTTSAAVAKRKAAKAPPAPPPTQEITTKPAVGSKLAKFLAKHNL